MFPLSHLARLAEQWVPEEALVQDLAVVGHLY